ncbi:MAG: molybdopterin-guanine dinucleotide biosynthesis protein B [Rhizobiales bacterium]|nr:molybdopterin-guanine dinucleotide biosynthesis protein B [Hyphomicrobiales bacterium]
MTQRVLGIAGYKNAGKTTLTANLVAELTGRGYKISTIKHAHHHFDLDHPGRDSYRHREAGAQEVAIVSRNRWALIHELRTEDEPPMEEMLAKLAPCDLVIIEGYRHGMMPKIEAVNVEMDHPRLAGEDKNVVAVCTNGDPAEEPLPAFDRDDIPAIADFIVEFTGLGS